MRNLPAIVIYVWAIGGMFSTFVHADDSLKRNFLELERVGYHLMFAIGMLIQVVSYLPTHKDSGSVLP